MAVEYKKPAIGVFFMGRLKNKTIFITGASGGIGVASAKLFISEGANVILFDLKNREIESQSNSFSSNQVLVQQGDVTKREDILAAIKAGEEQFGPLNCAFLNAGIEGPVCPLSKYSEEDFSHVLDVNVKGVFLGIQAVVPSIRSSNGGSIVLTSSLAGLRGMSKISGYVASKHAVVGLMKSAALELAKYNIRVNTINPAPIATRMIESLEEGFDGNKGVFKQKMIDSVPLKRYGRPDEVAELALFLCSDNSNYISGNCYPIDGGSSAK